METFLSDLPYEGGLISSMLLLLTGIGLMTIGWRKTSIPLYVAGFVLLFFVIIMSGST